MKTTIRLFFVSVLLVSVTGCYITKQGRLCGITTSQNSCYPNTYRELMHPTPLRDYWVGSDSESRSRDWVDCGGNPDGWANTDDDSRFLSIERCMLKKNYQYIRKCDSEFRRTFPSCGAP